MATATVAPEGVETRDGAVRAWQVARWLTLALFVVTLLAAVLGGTRTASYDDLRDVLQRGAVTEVVVESFVGDLAPDGGPHVGWQGVTTVRLSWQDGWHRSAAEIKVASSAGELLSQGYDPEADEHIIGDVDAALRAMSPDVRIDRVDWRSGVFASFHGWEVRGWSSVLPMALVVATLGLIVTSPQPRLATRWGWVWLTLSPWALFVIPAFLLLAGKQHVPGQRRLNGIVAFLICVIFAGAAR